MNFSKYQEKNARDDSPEPAAINRNVSTVRASTPSAEDIRGREFPVNHDWDESSNFPEPPLPIIYSTCALTIWRIDGLYGFLCDKNTLWGNLHFYADATTVVEEEGGKLLGELPTDRIRRGHRVEIEAEFLEPDLTNTDIHHLIHVRKILKLGSDQSLELVQTQILVPLTKKKAMPYYRALAESSDLVYIHPSILFNTMLVEPMKEHLPFCRPAFVDNSMEMLLSNRTIRGKVTIAPRWVGDIIGRLCNLKRVLLSCEPYGDTAQGFGTVVEAKADLSVVIQSHSRSDRVYCSLISASPEPKVSYKVGCHVRYTACLDLPNSTYKWRCMSIAKTSWTDGDEPKVTLHHAKAKRRHSVMPTSTQRPCFSEPKSLVVISTEKQTCTKKKLETKLIDFAVPVEREKAELKKYEKIVERNALSPPGRVFRPLGYPVEANEKIPICMNENPRKVFRYGDEPHCHFTIPDDLERSHYANFSPLYKSMEDFLLRHRYRRDKTLRRMKDVKSKDENTDEEKNDGELTNEDAPEALDTANSRFQFVGIGDDIETILSSSKKTEEPPKENAKPRVAPSRWPEGRWYCRTRPRIYPTVVVAEFIKNRDVEKDCKEDVNVYHLSKTITIRNSGVFVDDGIFADSSEAAQNVNATKSSQVKDSAKGEPNLMSLIGSDEVIGKFFDPLLKKTPKS